MLRCAVLSFMQAVVHGGVTAAAVIHQPSFEIFCMFDDLLLLGKGGRTVYYGLQAEVQACGGAAQHSTPQRRPVALGTVSFHPPKPALGTNLPP